MGDNGDPGGDGGAAGNANGPGDGTGGNVGGNNGGESGVAGSGIGDNAPGAANGDPATSAGPGQGISGPDADAANGIAAPGTASFASFAQSVAKGMAGLVSGNPVGIVGGLVSIGQAVSSVNSQGGFAGASPPGSSTSSDSVGSGGGGGYDNIPSIGTSANFDTGIKPPIALIKNVLPRYSDIAPGKDTVIDSLQTAVKTETAKDITPIYIQNSSLADAPKSSTNYIPLAMMVLAGMFLS